MTDAAEPSDATREPHDAAPDPYPGDTLPAALARHAIEMTPEQTAGLDRYCRALWEWNERLNLTRHVTYEKFTARDVVDVRALAAHIEPGKRVIDVGTGGGVPGVVLKIIRSDLDVTLTETVGKKARAVEAIVRRLELPCRVHHGRAEDLLATRRTDVLVVRAVAPLAKLCTWFTPLRHAFDHMLVIKGPGWVDERHEARQRHLLEAWHLRKVDEWPLPGSENRSVLLELRRREE